MVTIRRLGRLLVAMVLGVASATLAACGGGGGGGGGSGGGSTSPPPPPPAALIAISSANAPVAAGMVLKSADRFGDLLEAITQYAYEFGGILNVRTRSCAGGGELTSLYSDDNMSLRFDAGDRLILSYNQCEGRLGSIIVAVDALTGRLDTLAGVVTVSIQVESPADVVVSGSFRFTYNGDASSSRWNVADASVLMASANDTVSMTSFDYTKLANPAGISVSLNGSVTAASVGGRFTFDTPVPLGGAHGSMPSSGTLLLTGTGTAARVRAGQSAVAAEIAVDGDGNGSFESSLADLWSDLFAASIYEVNNPAITIPHVDFSPSIPIRGESIEINPGEVNRYPRGIMSSSFGWSINGAPVANATSDTLPPDLVRRGDLLQATFRLTDGIHDVSFSHAETVGNAQPFFLSRGLSPANPDTTETIRATSSADDPDGDTLTYSYEWFRNGVLLPGYTASTIPPSETVKGDRFQARIWVTDGIASESSSTGGVTVRDSPPMLNVNLAPASANLGDPVAFLASLTDLDGDPVGQFELTVESGPSGMVIDPQNGVITWTAAGPMFGPEKDVHWSVDAPGYGGAPRSGTIRVIDTDRQYPWLRTGRGIGDTADDGIRVRDFDSDGDNSLIVVSTYGVFEHEWDGTDYRVVWSHPFAARETGAVRFTAAPTSAAAGDIDGDGHQELFISGAGGIVRLEGRSRQIAAALTLALDEFCADLEVADLTGDGDNELICAMGNSSFAHRVVAYDASTMSELWRSEDLPQLSSNTGRSIAVGNVDSDPALEIASSYGKVYDGASLALQWAYAGDFGRDVEIGDVDGNGTAEIVAARGNEVRGYQASSQALAWSFATWSVESVAVANLDLTPRPELILEERSIQLSTRQLSTYSYDPATAAFALIAAFPVNDTSRATAVGDTDNDGALELISTAGALANAYTFFVAGLDPPAVEYPTGTGYSVEPPYAGGLAYEDGDGTKSVVFISEESYHFDLARLVPETGDVLQYRIIESGLDARDDPALLASDYDNDMVDELLIATDIDRSPRYIAYDMQSDTIEWMSPPQTMFEYQDLLAAADFNGDGRADLLSLNDEGWIQVFDIYAQSMILNQPYRNRGGGDVAVADLEGDGDLDVVISWGDAIEVLQATTNPFAFVARAAFSRPAGYSTGSFWEIDLGDSDDDGALEVFAIFLDSPDPSVVVHLDENLQLISLVETEIEGTTILFDSWATPARNVIVATKEDPDQGSYIAGIDIHSGQTIWRSPNLIGWAAPRSLNRVDWGGPDGPSLSLGTSTGIILTR